jgi:tryptophan synthase beta chain
MESYGTHYIGRPSPLYYGLGDDPRLAHAAGEQDLAEDVVHLVRAGVVQLLALEEDLRAQAPAGQGAKIFFKREELNHTGSHKVNNVLGQILLAFGACRSTSTAPM